MAAILHVLRSARLALAVLLFLAVYSAAGAWAPWSLPGGNAPPSWAVAAGLDHPFLAWPFLVAVAVLFVSTWACTWGRRARILRTLRADLPPSALVLEHDNPDDLEDFLRDQGFRRRGGRWLRMPAGLWGGWVLHVGLLVLMAGVLAQQALQDTGLVELTEGETLSLRAPGALRTRERGLLAPAEPPDVELHLEVFDPYARQDGYAPDRHSVLVLTRPGQPPERVTLDRADGVQAAGATWFHGFATGLSINLEVPGQGARSVHLEPQSRHVAAASVTDPSGRSGQFTLTAERPLGDPVSTGALLLEYESGGPRRPLQRNTPFRFGEVDAQVRSVSRWAQFSYAVSPGMPGVLAGFLVVLLGCLLLVFPAGVAQVEPHRLRVAMPRGQAALQTAWVRFRNRPKER